MTTKTVVLMNDPCPDLDSSDRVKYHICRWTVKQQLSFWKRLRAFQPQLDDDCGCCFSVESGKKHVPDLGLMPGKEMDVIAYWPKELRLCNPDEFAVIIYPDSKFICKCGATSSSQCLGNLKSGKCTASAIKTLVGIPLFPHLYANKEK